MTRTVIAVAALLAATAVFAQDPESPLFVESIEVRVVSVDVVVTDEQGRPIEGLQREDFELLEDGKPVDIAYFSRISEGRLDHDELKSDAAPQQPARQPVTWAIYLDQSNLKFGRRNQALRELRTFLEGVMQTGDRAIVATFDGQVFRVRTGVTADRDFLLRTLQQLEKERFHPGPAALHEVQLRGEIEQVTDVLTEGPVLSLAVSMIVEGEFMRTRASIMSMQSLLDVVSGVDGRLAIVYIGAGFNTLPGLSITETFRRRIPQFADGPAAPRPEDRRFELEQEITRLATRVSATRATVYSIHAGDPGYGMLSVDDKGSYESVGGVLGEGSQLAEVGSIREIAERTGGRWFMTTDNLGKQLAVVATDLNHYYSLGYVPKGEAVRTRDVRVRVKTAGARVRHREAVRERTPEEMAGDAVVTALFSPSESNPLAVRVETEPKRGKVLPIRVLVPLGSLTFLPQDEVQRAGLVFHFALAGKDGSIWRFDSRELPVSIRSADFARMQRENVTYAVTVPLHGAGDRLAVSVQDRIGQVRSLVTVPLEKK